MSENTEIKPEVAAENGYTAVAEAVIAEPAEPAPVAVAPVLEATPEVEFPS
jgi:hypothetical protein